MAEHEEALHALRGEHERALAEKESLLEWNARTIASLEEDVESYRQRIKVVLLERDTLRAESQASGNVIAEPKKAAKELAAVDLDLECCSPADGPNCAGCEGHFSLEPEIATEELIDVAR